MIVRDLVDQDVVHEAAVLVEQAGVVRLPESSVCATALVVT